MPEQLLWLSGAGVFVAIGSLTVTPKVYLPKRARRFLVTLVGLAFIAVVAIRATLVEEIEIRGKDYRFLVGTTLTDLGKVIEQNCLQGTNTQNLRALPRHELIRCAGDTSIPAMYGSSYAVVAIIYVIAYLFFLAGFVLLVSTYIQPMPREVEAIPDARTELKEVLTAEMVHEKAMARLELAIAHILFWAALLASIMAALAGYFSASKALIAALAALPALIMLIEQTFSFEARADWHSGKMYGLKELVGLLAYDESIPVRDVFDRRTKLEKTMESKFPALRTPFLQRNRS